MEIGRTSQRRHLDALNATPNQAAKFPQSLSPQWRIGLTPGSLPETLETLALLL